MLRVTGRARWALGDRRWQRRVIGDEYARGVGQRLRRIRMDKGMSLGDVNEASEGRWKAAVIGAYERGDRNITVARLAELAAFYAVSVSELIPEEEASSEADVNSSVMLLTAENLDALTAGEREIVERFADSILLRRGELTDDGAVSIRSADLDALALVLGTTSAALADRLWS
jgi:transcriptional regulator with XRE-family HTH domain